MRNEHVQDADNEDADADDAAAGGTLAAFRIDEDVVDAAIQLQLKAFRRAYKKQTDEDAARKHLEAQHASRVRSNIANVRSDRAYRWRG